MISEFGTGKGREHAPVFEDTTGWHITYRGRVERLSLGSSPKSPDLAKLSKQLWRWRVEDGLLLVWNNRAHLPDALVSALLHEDPYRAVEAAKGAASRGDEEFALYALRYYSGLCRLNENDLGQRGDHRLAYACARYARALDAAHQWISEDMKRPVTSYGIGRG